MPLDVKQVQSVFLAAVEVNEPSQRSALLDRRCGDNARLRRRVEALLKVHDEPGELPKVQLGLMALTDETTPVYSPGMLIAGRYKLVEGIAEGGMGTVWVAQQTEPVRRLVALKLIKVGMDSRQVLSRFEAERQALALMDHPNIAKVFDGGVTDEGRPFFVMEYVKGLPITEYSDQARLALDERLNLFVQVCEATQHAHQKGIIHRDLKPSNVLVCRYDDKAVPKVIDFGLAKAMHEPLTEHTLYTAHGLMMGTPKYMSPEQAEFNNLDIDTRSDVYSLGVILYELLTGTTPLEGKRFKDASWQEILRLIKEEEPTKPSTKLSSSGTLPTIAAHRSLEAARLCRAVRGDLDWITMKALEKDRSRRYKTASDLARDIERYLRHELVEARPPSAGYRFRKFARRNRAILTTAMLVSTALVAGTIVSSWQAIRATRSERVAKAAQADETQQRRIAEDQRNAANAARGAEAQQRKVAEDQRNDAEQRRTQAEANFQKAHWAMHYYVTSLNENKQLNVPALQTLRTELLDSALTYYRQLIDEFGDDPAVQPQLADAYIRVGNLTTNLIDSQERALAALEKGTELYERLARENPAVDTIREGLAVAYNNLGGAQRGIGRLREAEVSYQRGLEIYEKLAAEDPHNSRLQAGLARALLNFDSGQKPAGWPTDAEASLRRGLEIFEKLAREAPGDSSYRWGLAGASYELGHLQRMTGRLADAQASYQRTLEIDEQLVRENPAEADHSVGIARAFHYLGSVQRMTGRWEDAQASCQRALEIFANLVRENPRRASYRMEAARAYFHFGLLQSIAGRRDEAVQSWTAAATSYAATVDLGYTAPQVFSELGDTLAMLDKWQESADAFAKAADASHRAWEPQSQLALLQWAAGDVAGYRASCADLLSRHGDKTGAAEGVAIAMACTAGPGAVDDMQAVLAIIQRTAASNPKNPVFQTLVGAVQFRAGQTQEAIRTLKKSVPMHSFAALAAPKQLDQIRISQLTGETILALAYHEARDEQALAKQLDELRDLIEKLESTTPQYSEGLGRWALPLTILCAKRDLARLDADRSK